MDVATPLTVRGLGAVVADERLGVGLRQPFGLPATSERPVPIEDKNDEGKAQVGPCAGQGCARGARDGAVSGSSSLSDLRTDMEHTERYFQKIATTWKIVLHTFDNFAENCAIFLSPTGC